ncbi:MAG: molybdopterin-dependent oxidoreductase [Pseudomonadota bacterium]
MHAGKSTPNHPGQLEDRDAQQTHFTTCYMCACRCGIKVTVENDRVRFIQGNPNHPVNKGVLCAKGNAGIMKQESPAKLRHPMIRRPGTERGAGIFDPISWDDALELLTNRLRNIRASDPKKLAFFTGRDQMQALTGLWATQFGTINWAAHGGFCSVNMAAAGLYTLGHSFWEFGEPDWDHTRYFMMWGVAEDHGSNPIKIGLKKLKDRGAKFVAVNPVRTGYQAIADEWIAIKPGTDGLFALAMVHVLLKHRQVDNAFLVRYTNLPWLVIDDPGGSRDGLFWRGENNEPIVWDEASDDFADGRLPNIQPTLVGEFDTPDGFRVRTAMSLLLERYLDERYAPEQVADRCGISAADIERIALELAHVAFEEEIIIDTEWTDWAGRRHENFVGRPVSMHAMRGISAHSNGFQTCRALHLLQILLGTIDCPGGHLAKPPYPKHIPPGILPAGSTAPNTPLGSPPLGFPTRPEDLVIDEQGQPLRIDKAYSWEAPLANHGLMQSVIRNAVRGDPYPIDTLMLFMANMAWNSSMNTAETLKMLTAKSDDGDYKIPFIVTSDAFASEMVNYSDLVLPDTTYLERFDTISMLDRPISEPHLACDAIRAPILKPDRDVRSWQEVIVDLAGRLEFPAFVDEQGLPKYKGYEDFIVNFERAPGIGFLSGWRGSDGKDALVGEPNPRQWQDYVDNECFFEHALTPEQRYLRHANGDYLNFAKASGWVGSNEQIILEPYSETLQRFRLAGLGVYEGPCPKDPEHQKRLATYFDPLPEYYEPFGAQADDEFPFNALTQRPMFMYHSWDSQNAWLRQIQQQNYLYINEDTASQCGVNDLDWVWVESRTGKVRAQIKTMRGLEANTVWTWNALGKQRGTWSLAEDAKESRAGFLLNHLISDVLVDDEDRANGDPITGQAAWYDLKVKISPAADGGEDSWPQWQSAHRTTGKVPETISYTTHANKNLRRQT